MREQPLIKSGFRLGLLLAASSAFAVAPVRAEDNAETIKALQRQIDELRAQVQELSRARAAENVGRPTVTTSPESSVAAPAKTVTLPQGQTETLAAAPVAAQPAATKSGTKAWYQKLQLRGYTQLRVNENLASASPTPAGFSRFRSVQDSGVADDGNFSFRRIRLIVQGDVSDRVGVYVQTDLAAAVSNQSGGERREHFAQLRDAYADLYFANRKLKLRFGQSKVPYGWENLQSSSNRLPLDRADAANSAVPGERDLGVAAYYTPHSVQVIWDDLLADHQKLFGNYGAFGVGLFNGQGINRTEKDNGLMKVAMITWPFRLDGLGELFAGQVLEVGAQGLHNSFKPELRSGGVSPIAFDERRVNLHAVLYPAPFGLQAEWNWGRGPEWSPSLGAITSRKLSGGYVQVMYRIQKPGLGTFMPYARWQTYNGGWKVVANAPRIATDEIEVGVEWQVFKELELTLAYADSKRSEADITRVGQAERQLLRAQMQWNF